MSYPPSSPPSSSSTPSLETSRNSSSSESSFPSSPKQLELAMPLHKKPRPPSLLSSLDSPVFFSDSNTDSPSLPDVPRRGPRRPALMPRQTSYSKRHASFDTPREVPGPPDAPASQKDLAHPRPRPQSVYDSSGSSTAANSNHATEDEGQSESIRHPPFCLADRSSTSSLLLPSNIPYSYFPSLIPTDEASKSPSPANVQSTPVVEGSRQDEKESAKTVPLISHPPTPPPSARPPLFAQRHSDSADPHQMNTCSAPIIPATPPTRPTCKARPQPQIIMSGFPPPDPPVVQPLPSPTSLHRSASTRSAAHDSFLPHEPAPISGNPIVVETHSSEYKLLVNLPGYKRDCITLATRRRRILQVMADSWEQGGGHFERRISFGYDADLNQVRAEFDGDILRISIPRRSIHTWWNT